MRFKVSVQTSDFSSPKVNSKDCRKPFSHKLHSHLSRYRVDFCKLLFVTISYKIFSISLYLNSVISRFFGNTLELNPSFKTLKIFTILTGLIVTLQFDALKCSFISESCHFVDLHLHTLTILSGLPSDLLV